MSSTASSARGFAPPRSSACRSEITSSTHRRSATSRSGATATLTARGRTEKRRVTPAPYQSLAVPGVLVVERVAGSGPRRKTRCGVPTPAPGFGKLLALGAVRGRRDRLGGNGDSRGGSPGQRHRRHRVGARRSNSAERSHGSRARPTARRLQGIAQAYGQLKAAPDVVERYAATHSSSAACRRHRRCPPLGRRT